MTDTCTINKMLVGFLFTFFRHSSVMILELSMMSRKGVKKRELIKMVHFFTLLYNTVNGTDDNVWLNTNMLPQNFSYQKPAKSTFFFISVKMPFPSSLNYKVSYKLLNLFFEI